MRDGTRTRLTRGSLSIALALGALLAAHSIALARPGGPGMGNGPGPGHPHPGAGFEQGFSDQALAELGVSEAKRAEIRAIREAARVRGDELREAIRSADQTLREAIDADMPDREAIMAQVDALGALQIEARRLAVETRLAMLDLLTPEQRAAMATRREARQQKRAAQHASRIQAACGDSVSKYCAGVQAGPALGNCMRAHRDDLSDTCRDALRPPGPHAGPGGEHRCHDGCPHGDHPGPADASQSSSAE